MSPLKAESDILSPAICDKVVALRREIHRFPELKFQEKRTQELVLKELKKLDIKARPMAGTGVHAVVKGGKGRPDGKVLMLRADMDALPVEEEAECEYRSRHKGVMHACGHDAHVAMLLCVAALLREKPVGGPVKLCFQPAEEGGLGAQVMIDERVLEDPPVAAAFGIHIWAGIPSGKMGIAFGPCMAAVDEFELVVKGVGGHAAYPHRSVDPILVSAQMISSLQSVVSRSIDPIDTAVVTIGSIHGGTGFNIIPPEVKMLGTCRTFSDKARRMVRKRFHEITRGVAKSMGGSVEIDYRHLLPSTINDRKMCEIMWEAAAGVLGKRNVIEAEPTMGGEDMGLYLRKVPGCFAFLGTKNAKKGAIWPHHHPKFAIDEDVLPYGVEILYRAAELYYA